MRMHEYVCMYVDKNGDWNNNLLENDDERFIIVYKNKNLRYKQMHNLFTCLVIQPKEYSELLP